MPTTQSSWKNPRQTLLMPAPIYSDVPSRLLDDDPAPPTPSTSLTAGFFTPSAVVPAMYRATLAASSASISLIEPTPTPEATAKEAAERAATVSGTEVDVMGMAGVDASEVATPLATGTAAASGTPSAGAEPQNAAVTMSPGGIATGSIAGVAFLVSLIFLVYKWRRGTLPQTLSSAARIFKLRSRESPAPEADSMEKGLRSDAESIRSQSASIHSVSSLMSTFSSLKRSVSRASSREGGRDISRPAAGEGQGDKLAVPLQLQLARLEAAGLWTANTEGPTGPGRMDPRPVVEGPDIHPLRAHRVRKEGDQEPSAWPL